MPISFKNFLNKLSDISTDNNNYYSKGWNAFINGKSDSKPEGNTMKDIRDWQTGYKNAKIQYNKRKGHVNKI